MTWWFHLLVRRVDSLGDRIDVHERLVRAVGKTMRYADRCGPLLLRVESLFYRSLRYSVHGLCHRGGDLPALVWADGSCQWSTFGTRSVRPDEKPDRIFHFPSERRWMNVCHGRLGEESWYY